MNIYILTEITKREIDSNILLSVLAAYEGHDVIISNMSNLEKLIENKLLKPGIFHTKSLVHDKKKRSLHEKLKASKMILTSLDEENGLVRNDLNSFLEMRFSDIDISLCDNIFCWGNHDYLALLKKYPKFKNKFVLTGAPRSDMWTKKFSKYWTFKKKNKKKKILISLNFALVNGFESIKKIFFKYKKNGYFERSPNYKKELIQYIKESKIIINEFVKTINYLVNELNDYEFIIRPHPSEKILFWKKNITPKKNVTITNNGNFNEALSEAKFLIHNGSTTAFQAAIKEIPIISYVPIKSKISYGKIANELGIICKNKEKIKKNILDIDNQKKKLINQKKIKKILNYKLLLRNSLSASNILNCWKNLNKHNTKNQNDFFKIKLYIFLLDKIIIFKKYIFRIINPLNKKLYDNKFENLSENLIKQKIFKLKKILKINIDLNVSIVAKKFLIIKKN